MAHEEWRDVVGYEGLYQISNLGRVKSLDRLVNRNGSTLTIHGRMRKVLIDTQNGYPYLMLNKNGRGSKAYIHRLIAEAFIPNPNHYECVDHINGVRTDSYLGNLRWCSRLQNVRFAIDMGTIRPQDKSSFMKSGIVQEASRKVCSKPVIRSDGKRYQSIREAAKDTGVAQTNISAVLHGKRPTCGGFTFSFA